MIFLESVILNKVATKLLPMKPNLFLLLILLNICFCIAQKQELKKVNLEMLNAKQSSIDSTASAEVLYEQGEVSFMFTSQGVSYIYKVTRRIKIYNTEGYQKASIQIPYYFESSGSSKERIKKIKAKTYFLEDGKLKTEKVNKNEIFEVELSDYYKAKKFTFPKVDKGVIIEYSYTEISPYFKNLPEWRFQSDIPKSYSEFKTHIPTSMIAYRYKTRGYVEINTNIKEGVGSIGGSTGRHKISTTTHFVSDMEALSNEKNINNISNYISSVNYEMSSYKVKGGDVKHASNTWANVVETLKESKSFSKELNHTKYFEEDIDLLIENASSDEEKVEIIFDFVKTKMKWNKESRRYTSNRLKKVYEEEVGNVADINIMLTAMLRYANLNANPVVLSTIGNGIPVFPTVSGFNYVITRVQLGDTFILLDATNQNNYINILPKRAMNHEGLELTPTSYRKTPLIPTQDSKVNYNLVAQIDENGTVAGQCRIYYFNQFALNARNTVSEKKEEVAINLLKNTYGIDHISNFSQENLTDLKPPFLQNFSFENLPGFIDQIGEKIYLSPLLFLGMTDNPFKEKERKYPVDFSFPKSYSYRLQIDLPSGYKVEYIPEQSIYQMDNKMLHFSYIIQEQNGKLNILVSKHISTAFVFPEDYPFLSEYYLAMFEKENEKVVLVKK